MSLSLFKKKKNSAPQCGVARDLQGPLRFRELPGSVSDPAFSLVIGIRPGKLSEMKPQGAVERGRGRCGRLGPAGWPGARPRALQLRVLCICLCGAPPRWGVAGGGWSTFFLTDWHLYNPAPASPRPVPSPIADINSFRMTYSFLPQNATCSRAHGLRDGDTVPSASRPGLLAGPWAPGPVCFCLAVGSANPFF